MNYQSKYLKYKAKYFRLKLQTGGTIEAASSSSNGCLISSPSKKKWAIMVFPDKANYDLYENYNKTNLNNEYDIYPIDKQCDDAPNCIQLTLPDEIDNIQDNYFDMISCDEDTLYWIQLKLSDLHKLSTKLTNDGCFYLLPEIIDKSTYMKNIHIIIEAVNKDDLEAKLETYYLKHLFPFNEPKIRFISQIDLRFITVYTETISSEDYKQIYTKVYTNIIQIWLQFCKIFLENFYEQVTIEKDNYPSPKLAVIELCTTHGYIRAFKPKEQKNKKYLTLYHKAIPDNIKEKIFTGNELVRHNRLKASVI